jgi:hypothetical protein
MRSGCTVSYKTWREAKIARTTIKALLVGSALMASAASADAESLEQWLGGAYATGTWGGARTQLEEACIKPEIAYTTDLMAVTNGNAGSGDGWDYAGRVDAGLTFDLEQLLVIWSNFSACPGSASRRAPPGRRVPTFRNDRWATSLPCSRSSPGARSDCRSSTSSRNSSTIAWSSRSAD